MSLLYRPDDYIGFTPSCLPHILQKNRAHAPEAVRISRGRWSRNGRL